MEKERVVKTWLLRGVEDFYISFVLSGLKRRSLYETWCPYEVYFLILGLEKLCKSYLLGKYPSEYEGLDENCAGEKINETGKKYGHSIKEMLNKINTQSVNKKIKQEYDGYDGRQLLEVLPEITEEIRYPVPKSASFKFPIKNTGLCYDPLYSSGLRIFCKGVAKEIQGCIKKDFSISISDEELKRRIPEKVNTKNIIRERFAECFLINNK